MAACIGCPTGDRLHDPSVAARCHGHAGHGEGGAARKTFFIRDFPGARAGCTEDDHDWLRRHAREVSAGPRVGRRLQTFTRRRGRRRCCRCVMVRTALAIAMQAMTRPAVATISHRLASIAPWNVALLVTIDIPAVAAATASDANAIHGQRFPERRFHLVSSLA